MTKNYITFFLCILLCNTSLAVPSQASSVNPALESYVSNLIAKTDAILNNPHIGDDEKLKRTRELVVQNLDFKWMAKYSLGRLAKNISSAQLQEFTIIYSQYVVSICADLVKQYRGEKTTVKKIVPISNDLEFMVTTEVTRSDNQAAVKVDYLIHKTKSGFTIADMITEGISMINSQKAEFAGLISNGGIDVLTSTLKSKIK